ncbi:MAG: hypothetical protein AAGF84_05625 [Planctomycetota bacterium]
MGSVIAVASLGLCAVAVGSVTALVRMDVQRTQRLANEAQALTLLSAGADYAIEAATDEGFPLTLDGGRGLRLPLELTEGRHVALAILARDAEAEGDREWVTIDVRATVGGTQATQQLQFVRAEDASNWRIHGVELGRFYSSP